MDNYRNVLNILEQHQSFALSTHINPDGDALGSEFAVYAFLKELGKDVRIFNTHPVPRNYQFLPFCDAVQTPEAVNGYRPEILIIVDSGTLARIGEKLSEILQGTEGVVNIDHHATADIFGDYRIVDSEASSTAELIYGLLKQHEKPITSDQALCLYTGMMFDTGGFRYSNTTPTVHRIAAELIEIGNIKVDEVYRHVYDSVPLRKMLLLRDVLKTLGVSSDGQIGWLYATQAMLARVRAVTDDVEGFVNHPRSIDTVEVSIFASEVKSGASRISLRSKSRVDVGKVAAAFGGGGHQRASGCVIDAPPKSAIDRIVKYIEELAN